MFFVEAATAEDVQPVKTLDPAPEDHKSRCQAARQGLPLAEEAGGEVAEI
jgi:hypothetical protein